MSGTDTKRATRGGIETVEEWHAWVEDLQALLDRRDSELKEANGIIKGLVDLLARYLGEETPFDPHERALILRVKKWASK